MVTMDYESLPRRIVYPVVALRVMLGWIFLHAGLDKLESGFQYTYASTYLSEATPVTTPTLDTTVSHLLELPLYLVVRIGAVVIDPLLQLLAQLPYIGTLVILSELFVGVALVFGAATRLGAYAGAFMMTLFYYGNAAWEHGLLNSDMAYLVLFLCLAAMGAGRMYGLDRRIEQHPAVADRDWLRYLLG